MFNPRPMPIKEMLDVALRDERGYPHRYRAASREKTQTRLVQDLAHKAFVLLGALLMAATPAHAANWPCCAVQVLMAPRRRRA